MKYIKMICTHCQGNGKNFGYVTRKNRNRFYESAEYIKCKYCNGTGYYKAEIVEEKDEM
jgi:hypothetical protein